MVFGKKPAPRPMDLDPVFNDQVIAYKLKPLFLRYNLKIGLVVLVYFSSDHNIVLCWIFNVLG